MITWILLVILVLVIAFFILTFSKMSHTKHRLWIVLLVFIFLFLIGTLYIVSLKNNLDFTSVGGFMNSMKIYGGWLANGFQNLKELGGQAVKQDWISTNGSSVSSNSNSYTVPKAANRVNERV